MFGYACNDTPEMMPLPIPLAHRIINALTLARREDQVLVAQRPGESQVTVEYDGNGAVRDLITPCRSRLNTRPEVSNEVSQVRDRPRRQAWSLPEHLLTGKITYHIDPTGRFVVGGPHGDCGLTGRKIIVDTYGGWGRHGGGAFSGKDPTKVDRSAAYMALHVGQEYRSRRIGRALRGAVGLCHRRFGTREYPRRHGRHRPH